MIIFTDSQTLALDYIDLQYENQVLKECVADLRVENALLNLKMNAFREILGLNA